MLDLITTIEGQKDSGIVEEWVELAKGCVCCTVKHSLVQALEQLIERKDSNPVICISSGERRKEVKKACAPRRQSWDGQLVVFCQCCCTKPPSPPPPPPPSPPPPSPPPPSTPSGGECQDGDTKTETTIVTSNCADCTNWCKEECADSGATAVREIYEIVPARRWQEKEERMVKIVFIGRNLDEVILRDSFRTCTLPVVRYKFYHFSVKEPSS